MIAVGSAAGQGFAATRNKLAGFPQSGSGFPLKIWEQGTVPCGGSLTLQLR